jgi:protein-S-isoprenylcysteine O-methyltransferase Ste14
VEDDRREHLPSTSWRATIREHYPIAAEPSATSGRKAGLKLWARAVAYMCLFGTTWFLAIPAVLLRADRNTEPVLRPAGWVAFGVALLVAGCGLCMVAGFYLVTIGQGTPFPLDPTRALVTVGPYAYIRNPQAVGTLLIVVGEIAVFRSRLLALMLPLSIAYLEGVAARYEHRELRVRYGRRYLEYRKRVPRWLPRQWRHHRDGSQS